MNLIIKCYQIYNFKYLNIYYVLYIFQSKKIHSRISHLKKNYLLSVTSKNKWHIKNENRETVPYVTLEHKSSHKSLGYIYRNSQKYIVWVKIIDFPFMPKIIRILRSCSIKIFSKLPTVNISKLYFWLVICIAKNFIWTTLKVIFSILRFLLPQIPDLQILSNHNKPYINVKLIYSALRWCISKN